MQLMSILIAGVLVLTLGLFIAAHRTEKAPWHYMLRGDWRTAPLALILTQVAYLGTVIQCGDDPGMSNTAIVAVVLLLTVSCLLIWSRLLQIHRHAMRNQRQFQQNKHFLTEQDRADLGMNEGKGR